MTDATGRDPAVRAARARVARLRAAIRAAEASVLRAHQTVEATRSVLADIGGSPGPAPTPPVSVPPDRPAPSELDPTDREPPPPPHSTTPA
jgi:outer membrane protein TolC